MPAAPDDRGALNPALLKLRLLSEGVDAPAIPAGNAVEIEFEDGTIARARVSAGSLVRWAENGGRGEIRIDSGAGMPARMIDPGSPRNNAARGAIVEVRGRFATVTLGGGCGLPSTGHTCALCLGRELTQKAGEWWSPGEVVEALRSALRNTRAKFIHFNVGYLPGDSAGFERLRDYIGAVRRYLDQLICLTTHPPADLSIIDLTYAYGVDAVCYSLEAPDAASMERMFPGRARFLGRERYLAALARAAQVFPRGAVWSVVLGDAAPIETTRSAAAELIDMGVVPLLAFSGGGSVRAEEMAPVGAMIFQRLIRHTPSLHWSSGIAGALTPYDARYLAADTSSLPQLIELVNRNRLGAFAIRILTRMRRRLRVRIVEALDPLHP